MLAFQISCMYEHGSTNVYIYAFFTHFQRPIEQEIHIKSEPIDIDFATITNVRSLEGKSSLIHDLKIILMWRI